LRTRDEPGLTMSKAPKPKLELAHSGKESHKESFRNGETIPSTGLYSVRHLPHKLPAEVTVRKGEAFPHCAACSAQVTFVLLRVAPAESDDKIFKVVLYALPVIEDGEADAVAV
jgi:hypothetical protein